MKADATAEATTPRPLIIGVGNRDRGDDAIGPLAAQAFADRWPDRAEVLLAEGDLSDLSLRWRHDQFVVIVDALMSGKPAGTISTIDGLDHDLPSNRRLVSSHGVGLAEAISLAQVLERQPAGITIVGIEACQYEHFTQLSSGVAGALSAAVDRIRQVLDEYELDTVRPADGLGPPPLSVPASIKDNRGSP